MANQWQEIFLKRKRLRQNYFATNNPDIVKKNLIQELLSNIRDCPFEDMKELIDHSYHPDGPGNSSSYGNNPFFRALLSISDQIFIYDEFIQELGLALKENIQLVLPASKRASTFKHNSVDLDFMHKELKEKQKELEERGTFSNLNTNFMKMEMLETSPNKALLYNLIDDKNTQTELWNLFNKNISIKNNKTKEVSKQYIFQILREMEEDGFIGIRKRGKSRIAFKI